MTTYVSYINGIMTLTENVFNVCGYLPKHQFPSLNEESSTWRFRFGLLQAISGAALCAVGFLADSLNGKPDSKKYLTLTQQMVSLGQLYINHGLFNIIRSAIEKQGFGFLTAPYDFYGQKFLPALSAPCDLQERLFASLRHQLDRIVLITLFPPKFSLRSP